MIEVKFQETLDKMSETYQKELQCAFCGSTLFNHEEKKITLTK